MTTGTEQPNRAGLYRKIAAVAGAIAAVAKDGYNPQLKYKYATPATVMEAVKPLLAEQHLAIVPTMSQVVKEPTGSKTQSGAEKVLTRVEMIYLILDGESGESLSVPWAGEGEDWSDKGIAKAQTIALRTFLIQLFQIPAEDPDTDPDARQVQAPQQGQRQPARTQQVRLDSQVATYEPPPGEQPANGKKAPTREGMIARIRALWLEERQMGRATPTDELTTDLTTLSEAELITLGKQTAARVEKLRAARRAEQDAGELLPEKLPDAARAVRRGKIVVQDIPL